MSGSTRKPISAPNSKLGAKNAEDFHPTGKGGRSCLGSCFWAPADRHDTSITALVVTLSLVMFGTFMYTFAVIAPIRLISLNAFSIGESGWAGAIAVFALIAGTNFLRPRGNGYFFPVIVTWRDTWMNMAAGRLGPVFSPFYSIAQLIGALISGGLLYYFDLGFVLTGTPNVGYLYCLEILGGFFISFITLYNTVFGTSVDEEDDHRPRAYIFSGLFEAAWRAITWSKGFYSGDTWVYVAGVIGMGGLANASPFDNAAVFYVLLPIVPGICAALFVWLLLAIYGSPSGAIAKRVGSNYSEHSRMGDKVQ